MQNTWEDKLIMAKLKVLHIQRAKEMMIMLNKRSTLDIPNEADIGKADCKMDLKN